MKVILLLFALLHATNAKKTQLRNRELTATTDYFECILIEIVADLSGQESKFEHMCQGKDASGAFDMIYYIDDNNNAIPDLDEEGYDIMHNSGRYKLVLTNVIENSDPVITTTPDTDWDIVDLEGVADQGRRLKIRTTGTSTIAIVRVKGKNNAQPTKSASALSNAFFGTHGDPQNLKKRYDLCSFGKMIFTPATGDSFEDGVVEIEIDEPIVGQDVHTLSNKVTLAIYAKFGYHLFNKFDHIAYIMPDGTTYGTGGPKGWMAFAYIKQYLSVFNNENAMYLSHQVHEIGHNLGLYHSSHDNLAYGDQSGVMGYGYTLYDAPQMCFNGAKSWQLGWYNDKALELKSVTSPRSIYLSFFGNYDEVPNNSQSDVVLIRVGYYHILYNLKKGINSETMEFENKVTVTYMKNQRDLSSSKAALGPNDKFSFDGVTVEFCEAQNDKALLSIYPSGSSSTCGNFQGGLVSGGGGTPPIPVPVPAPVPAPIQDPTNRPVATPTRPPTGAPTPVPVNVNCVVGEMKIEVKVTTNNTPDKISWKLKERRGAVIRQLNQNTYSGQNTEYLHQFCVDESTIVEFHLKDYSGLENPGGRYAILVDGETYSEGDIVAEEVDYIQGKCVNAGEERLQFILNTGNSPEYVSWTLESNGNNMYTGGPWELFAGTPLHFFSNTCLDNSQCYVIKMKSSKKHMHTNKFDGLDGGSYEINWDNENVKFSTFETGEQEVTRFGNCNDDYYEPPEIDEDEPQDCDCTDEPIGWMASKGWECKGSHFITTKCNKNNHWTENKFCQLSCYQAGNGYPGDICNCK